MNEKKLLRSNKPSIKCRNEKSYVLQSKPSLFQKNESKRFMISCSIRYCLLSLPHGEKQNLEDSWWSWVQPTTEACIFARLLPSYPGYRKAPPTFSWCSWSMTMYYISVRRQGFDDHGRDGRTDPNPPIQRPFL